MPEAPLKPPATVPVTDVAWQRYFSDLGRFLEEVGSSTLSAEVDALEALVASPALGGRCRLVRASATQLRLDRYNGKYLFIDGALREIPAAGVTISNAGLTDYVVYYVYAYWTGAAIALELSTTGYSVDATSGHRIKTGDATRSLVGIAMPGDFGEFYDTEAERYVASWFNPPPRSIRGAVTPSSTTSSTSVVSPGISYEAWFVCFAHDAQLHVNGWSSNNTLNVRTAVSVRVDGAVPASSRASEGTSATANARVPAAATATPSLADGYHTAGPGLNVSANTGTFAVQLSGVLTA